ncbi:MAG: efflux RND transporter permease subunit [Candidatus Sericytochromatia bacterium]
MKKDKAEHNAFNISELAIKRPVSTIMMIFTLLVLGFISFSRLSVELFPNVSFPIVVISTSYEGASSKEIETLISKPLEDAVSSINGIEHIRSSSGGGSSIVIIEFKMSKDIKYAVNEVKEKVDLVKNILPKDLEADPIVIRVDPDAAPVVSYVVGGDYPLEKITDLVRLTIKPQIEQVDGVGSLSILGGREREVLVELNPTLLKKYGLSIAQVNQRIREENLNLPSGSIKTKDYDMSIRTVNAFKTAQQVSDIPIRLQGGGMIKLRDLGNINDGFKEPKNKAWLNDKTALVISVQKQSGTNTIEVVKKVDKKLEQMKNTLPKGIKIAKSFDTSQFVIESKDAAIDELIVGSILAIVVIYFFLRTIGATIIAGLAIPASVISTFTLMYAMDFSLNIMSLLGLSLVVGILVDDAVVDLENIYRRMELGENPYIAAINATNEIGLAVVATTFSIVAVFVPVGFMTGIIGQFFKQFALTVSFAVMVSLLVARTLTPTLSAYFLKPLSKSHEEVTGMALIYRDILAWVLRRRWLSMVLLVVVFVIGILIVPLIPKGFVPKNDRNEFSIALKMPSGSSLEQTGSVLREMAKRVHTNENVKELLVTAGSGRGKTDTGSIGVTLKRRNEGRNKTSFAIMDEMRQQLRSIPGAKISFREMRAVDDGSGNYMMNLSITSQNLDEIQKVADKVVEKLHTMKFVSESDTSSGNPQTELQIKLDPNKAASMGVSTAGISSTIKASTFGELSSKLKIDDNDIDIRVRMNDDTRLNINKVRGLLIPTNAGNMVPLESVASIKYETGPNVIQRYDRQRQIIVYANAVDGYSMSQIIDPVDQELKKMNLPSTISWSFTGDAERMAESFSALLFSLGVAIIFIYIILASQFEHFAHPFTIMMAMPLSFIGAFLGLFIANEELGMMSMIGVVMLMGLVVKNSILLVDYTIQMRKQGMERKEALLTAGAVRLRPILMTTVAMIAGMFPIALRLTPGSEGRSPMAVAVIGGLITSTILSLLVIPVFYTFMDDFIAWTARITGIKINRPEDQVEIVDLEVISEK